MDTEQVFQELQLHSNRLDQLIKDIAQFDSHHPMDYLQSLEETIDHLLTEYSNRLQPHSFDGGSKTEIPEPESSASTTCLTAADVDIMATICRKKLETCRNQYGPFCLRAEQITRRLITDFQKTHRFLQDYYASGTFGQDKKNTQLLFSSLHSSSFTHYLSDQINTWEAIRLHLPTLHQVSGGKKNKHNALTTLLNPDNIEFMDAIEYGYLGMHDEIGQLAILRLREIFNTSPKKIERVHAFKLLSGYLPLQVKDAPLAIDMAALEIEILKLAFYALMYPDNKTIWLGTSRAVNAMIEHHAGEAIYLNPDPKKLNWQLNKAWLLAAQTLGYQFELVEQHFPNIEKAILSRNPATLLIELAKEVRPSPFVSQYNGSDAPTSTTQEVLLLLSAGCNVSKESNGRITLLPGGTSSLPLKTPVWALSKSHSYTFFEASSPPPLARREDHFIPPGQEKDSQSLALPIKDGKATIGLL
ncbi:hypothetical protein [Legionella erythra]|uniref:Uncharacterized protein n=1 Tax=Legionella erythra TaxID=448 RepID=A0A0W0TJE4_LEGER|nr:hypothetical protein [Legionella erythra]KTC95714.1 hypothetical protein Lery_2009 [Legionella erythra]